MCGQFPKRWSHWIALAEWWYNTTFHSSISRSLSEALYGYTPPQLGYGPHLVSKTVGVEDWFKEHQVVTEQLKKLLLDAQNRMKHNADNHRVERNFSVGDWVYLKLKPYRQMSLRKSHIWKLTPKYCGPYPVIKRIGEVAYELQLPSDARVHPVFHVSQLKKHVGSKDRVSTTIPPMDLDGKFLLVPVKILDKRVVKRNNTAMGQWLIQWAHLPVEEATWEWAMEIMAKYPQLQP